MINIPLSGELEHLVLKVLEEDSRTGIQMLEDLANEMEAKYGVGTEPEHDHDIDFREECYQEERDSLLVELQMFSTAESR